MSIQLIENEIRRFLSTSEPEVICISGHWGVGKTFAWNRFLKDAKAKNEIALARYSYVSLFSVSPSFAQILDVPTSHHAAANEMVCGLPHSPRSLQSLRQDLHLPAAVFSTVWPLQLHRSQPASTPPIAPLRSRCVPSRPRSPHVCRMSIPWRHAARG